MSTIPSDLSAILVADLITVNQLPGYPATPTQVGGINVAAVIECQSTTRGFLLPRLTTAQRDAMTPVVNGMMIYNSTTNAVNTYEAGAWGAGGGGDVDGPGASTNQGLSIFDGVTGKLLAATTVLLNPATSVISAIGGLINGAGTAAVPTYTFTGDTNTGIYQSGADAIGFATAGVKQFVVSGGATSVNNLNIAGSATTAALTLTAEGTDATISISLVPKNNGQVFVNQGSAGNPGLAFNGGGVSTTSGLTLTVGGGAATNFIATCLNGAAKSATNQNSCLALGTTTFDATSTNALQLAAGTAPTGVANSLQIFGATVAGNVGTLGLRIPAGSLTASVDNVVTNKVQITVNGTTYYLLATTSAA